MTLERNPSHHNCTYITIYKRPQTNATIDYKKKVLDFTAAFSSLVENLKARSAAREYSNISTSWCVTVLCYNIWNAIFWGPILIACAARILLTFQFPICMKCIITHMTHGNYFCYYVQWRSVNTCEFKCFLCEMVNQPVNNIWLFPY
jgi:hypothetical protein